MFLLPLNRAEGGPRSVPWVTLAIIALNVVSLVAVSVATAEGPLTDEVGRLIAFLRQHPYLEMSPAMARMMDDELVEELGAARSAFLGSRPLPSLEVFERERHQLADHERSVVARLRELPGQRWGFVPAQPWSATILTSLFMHGDWMHLLGNLVFLWITAPFLEERLGRWGFAALYLAAGVAGSGAHAMRFPDSAIPLVGASGAIAGLMGAFVVYFAATRIRFLLLPTPVVITLPALVVFPLWLGEQMFFSRYGGADAGVAFGAHVGGFLFGLAAGGVARLARPDPSGGQRRTGAHGSLAADREAFEEALEEGDGARIGDAGARLLERLRQGGDAKALAFVEEVRERVVPLHPVRLWLAGASLLERSDPEGALAMYQELVDDDPDAPAALRALMRRGDVLRRGGRTRDARSVLQGALRHPACTPAFKEAIERSLAALPAAP
ncbi:MAG TPA: rhomboid family intramembrane serine protease [Vicinamibacteria bacterium]|nr:rhomboid family intramembrane serine protease [Vicinamibacteria bacterium]